MPTIRRKTSTSTFNPPSDGRVSETQLHKNTRYQESAFNPPIAGRVSETGKTHREILDLFDFQPTHRWEG